MTELSQDLAALRIERAPSGGRSGRWLGWVVLLLILGGGGFFGWRWYTEQRKTEVQADVVSERAAGAQAAVLDASGYVTARRRATVSSKITGKVIEVNVEEGMRVQEGQVLARLDDASARASLALAQAQAESSKQAVHENEIHLAQARVTAGRLEPLVKEGFASQSDLDQAKLDVDATGARIKALEEVVKVAQRQVELAQTDLDNTVIRAPFTGIAVTKDAQPGEMVSPVSAGGGFTRTGICTVVDMKSLEIDVDVSETYIGRVKPNQDVTAILNAYKDWEIPARVITVVPTADRQKATVLVRIAFKALDPRVLPDMGVKVRFLSEAASPTAVVPKAVILVAKAAVRTAGRDSAVFVLHDDTVERRAITLGSGADGDRLEVAAGLRPGERVVLSPPADLKDGDKVVVK